MRLLPLVLLLGCAPPTDGDPADDDDSAVLDDDDSTAMDDDDAADDDDATPAISPLYPRADYARLLDQAVAFYGRQRCGDAGNPLLVGHPITEHCHLQDGPAVGLDLVGGWHDAGDHLKFTLTTAWAAYALLKAWDAWPDAFVDAYGARPGDPANGIADVLDEARVATDWLLLATPDADTLVHRVGGEQDHDLWVTSPYQSTLDVDEGGGERPVVLGAQADVAGITAAALAQMARAWAPHDAAYAATCLEHARWAQALGEARPGTTDDPFYPDSSFEDDLLCGAVELHRATGEAAYLTAAEAHDAALGAHGWVPGWDQVADPCRHSLYVAGSTGTQLRWGADVARYPAAVSSLPLVNGLAWFLDWGSMSAALGAAASSALYHDAIGSLAHLEFAQRQVEYAMGDNEYGHPFVVGFGPGAPAAPHHQNAYGREALDWDLSQPHLHELTGALVGGPTQDFTGPSQPGYDDDVWDYVGNEVSLSYNAGLVLSAAAIVGELGR